MRRIHLFELEDQPWCPAVVRDAGTSFLRLAAEKSGHAAVLAEVLAEVVERTGASELVDLCSGGGGPMVVVARSLRARGWAGTVRLTDLYPNASALEAVAAASGGALVVEREPVDATAVPPHLRGLRVLCNGFHHFRPPLARRILEDAVRAEAPIAVLELVGREPLMLAGLLATPLSFTLALPFLRPFRWSWLPLTLTGVLPAFVLWDGIVSALRVYGVDELRELVQGLDRYDWDIRRVRLGAAPAHATVLVGVPRSTDPAPVPEPVTG